MNNLCDIILNGVYVDKFFNKDKKMRERMLLMDFKDIKNIGTTQMIGNKRTITGSNIYVGEGVLKCNNYFLSLDSICVVEMGRVQKSIGLCILIIILGILICMIPNKFFWGFVIIIAGSLGIYVTGIINRNIPYSLTIRLNNNMSFTYESLNRKFIEEIMDVIQSCINDRKGGYNILLNQGKIEHNNNSINIGGNISDSNIDIIAPGGSKSIGGDSRNTIYKQQNGDIGLTAEEWENLEKYFMVTQKEFPVNDINYKICRNLINYSHEKSTEKLKRYFGIIGQEAIKTILSVSTNVAATEVIHSIIQKILS